MTKKELRDLLNKHQDLDVLASYILIEGDTLSDPERIESESEEEITEDEARDILTDAINEQGIIYYSKAMDYLHDHDTSLCESLAIADEMEYELKNLNSEVLATLLYQRNLSEELETFLSETF